MAKILGERKIPPTLPLEPADYHLGAALLRRMGATAVQAAELEMLPAEEALKRLEKLKRERHG